MKKTVIYPAFLAIFLATGCAYLGKQPAADQTKRYVERLTVYGLSRDIITEAKQLASEHCKEQNRQYTFMRNIIRQKTCLGMSWLTYDLYFACTAEGELPPPLPPLPGEQNDITPDTTAPPDTPASAAVANAPPKTVVPKKKTAQDECGVGEFESLGPEPLGPSHGQQSASPDQDLIIEEILQ